MRYRAGPSQKNHNTPDLEAVGTVFRHCKRCSQSPLCGLQDVQASAEECLGINWTFAERITAGTATVFTSAVGYRHPR